MEIDSAALLTRLKTMSHEEMASTLALLEELESRKRIALAQMDFLAFIASVDPAYKFGNHLKRLGGLLMQIEQGTKDRIAVSIPPRFGKSLMISVYFPAWYLGKHPDHKVITASHTSDLAVDMARKVRNLMQTDEYKRIFPGVAIAADAKAAGKWNTTKGGEMYACIEPHTPVLTPAGYRAASTLAVGDCVLVGNTHKRVEAVFYSAHAATVRIDGVGFSANHPIWTANRGWVSAGEVKFSDTLWVENFWDILKALSRRAYGYLEHAHVPALVQHQVAVHQPEKRKVGALWRARNYFVRTVDGIRQLLHRHRGSAYAGAYRGPNRQRWAVQPGELSMGYAVGTSEQQIYQLGCFWGDDCAACADVGGAARNHNRANTAGDGSGGRCCDAEAVSSEFQAYDPPENHGWRASAFARWAGRCWASCESEQSGGWLESNLARGRRAAKVLQGLFLGVRSPLTITVAQHAPRPFINYRIAGGDVFYAGGILTHNCGVGGALAGRGANLAVVDDVLSEQDLKTGNTDSLDMVYEWFRAGLRTRLMPGGALCVLHTRWHLRDLIGRITKDAAMNPEADQYEIFEFPAILTTPNPAYDPEDPESPAELQKSLWPEQWPLEALLRTKASMPAWQWNAQYMQNPTAQEAALIKKDHIKWWPKDTPPECNFIVQAWDTAMTTKERSDYSVCQTWGVWTTEDGVDNVILLNCVRKKVEFPELKRIALEQVQEWEPDTLIVEAKASGQPLIDELRRSGIFVQEFSPGKGQDKIARVNSVADMFVSGQVWFPETQWATEVVEEICAFPSGEHDDCVDAMTLALRRARMGGLLRLTTDHEDSDPLPYRRRAAYY